LVKIGKVAKEVSARNGESEETVLSCSKYAGFVNSLDYFGKQVFSSDTSNYKVVKKGQFGYPSNHVEEGSIGLLEHCEKGIVSPIYVVFEVSKEKIHSPYLYKLLKTDIYRHIFQVSTSSSVDRRGSLRWGDFSKIKVLVPSLEEQQEISETLSSAQHEIDLLKQLANKYKTQKRGLMQKMLTGEWRIKPDVVKFFGEVDV
jgi:type I restriction enzyme S subunit